MKLLSSAAIVQSLPKPSLRVCVAVRLDQDSSWRAERSKAALAVLSTVCGTRRQPPAPKPKGWARRLKDALDTLKASMLRGLPPARSSYEKAV